mmetsp:Transcript_3945/g.9068  ORF Transcript_3945/g.9068 Transcript_3945/m.9068 type:complete len:335 (-) Transcript_3945:78-1082(-)
MGIAAASLQCQCCLDESSARPRVFLDTNVADEGVADILASGWWEEVMPASSEGAAGSIAAVSRSRPRRPSQETKLRNQQMTLEFRVGLVPSLGLHLEYRGEPSKALVVEHVDSQSIFLATADGRPGLAPGDTIVQVHRKGGTPETLRKRLHEALLNGRMAVASPLEALVDSNGLGKDEYCQNTWRADDRLEDDETSASGSEVGDWPPALGSLFSVVVWPRAPAYPLELERNGPHWRRLGLSVALRPDRGYMIVVEVHPAGLVADWNLRNAQQPLCAGDRITGVNEVSGNAFRMYSVVLTTSLGGSLRLQVETLPRSAVSQMEAFLSTLDDVEQL